MLEQLFHAITWNNFLIFLHSFPSILVDLKILKFTSEFMALMPFNFISGIKLTPTF